MAQAKKRKKFFDVSIPILKKETQLFGYQLSDFKGRIITYDLTRMIKGKGMVIKLKVEFDNEKPIAEPVELKVMPYFIRRMVRKRTNYVENSFSMNCKNAKVKVKPFLITRRKVSRAIRKALREKTKEEIIKNLKNKNSKTIFEELLKNKIQKQLSLTLNKIYPLSLCEIRIFKVEKELEKK